tara:strand:+ start:36921 stop:37193 length:273 start_codon:yes stop_codon:yes gene_type:complete
VLIKKLIYEIFKNERPTFCIKKGIFIGNILNKISISNELFLILFSNFIILPLNLLLKKEWKIFFDKRNRQSEPVAVNIIAKIYPIKIPKT